MDGRDPAREKKLTKMSTQAKLGQTFGAIGREYLEKRQKEGLAEATLKKKVWLFEQFEATLGNVPITSISSQEVFTLLDKVQQDRRETARRMRSLAGEVFNYAIATGRAVSNPTEALKRALLAPKVRHMPALVEVDDLKALLKAIDQSTGYPSTIGALRISPHLFQRPGEIRKMKWADLNFEDACWNIPASDMKKRRPHAVPLSRQAIGIIRDMELVRNGPFVFPAFHSAKSPISENTVNGALKRLGFKGLMTPHGFRSAASSLLNESGKWNPDAIERAMSRQVGSATAAIYNRSTYWSERVQMMQWWSDFLDELLKGP